VSRARALAFNFVFFAWTAIMGALGLPFLLAPRAVTMRFGRFWATGVLTVLKLIVGLGHEIRGLDRIPRGGCIIAMKHQSAWDTLVLPVVLDDPAPVVKRELLLLPFFGWYAVRAGSITIDRKGGAGALRRMVAKARPVAAAGRPIVIFPEGTRVAAGERRLYQPGVAALAPSRSSAVVAVSIRRSSSAMTRGRVLPGGIGSRNSRTMRPGRFTKLRRPQ